LPAFRRGILIFGTIFPAPSLRGHR